ncbi:MAG: class I tRNA ligase family protein [Planctomycetaceae bacterium]|jgi:isoleucyl-tRNA synthetase|nr:class I tRNA ligase family protein [Planctomycetaceae bacterium]MBT6487615.1 class I tRNA ligase family protein [Planctomycetaceae bacterium]
MFDKVSDANFVRGEHDMLRFWDENSIFDKLRQKNAGGPRWSFIDGPITANNPMGVHHAWGRTYKDAYQRYFAMTGHEQRYQNGFDCQGLWVEVEVERELGYATKNAIEEQGIDTFVNQCKKRVLRFAARQTEQSIRLGYWTDWDDPEQLRQLSEAIGTAEQIDFTAPSGVQETGTADELVARLGNPEWGGSYFTFSTENNETIWTFLKKCFERGKVYRGHDVMPWSGRGGSAYSQMEVADGRKLTTHESVFVRFPLIDRDANEFLLVWTTTPWTLTSNVACAVNPDLDYVKLRSKRDDAVYYFAADNLDFQRLGSEFKDGFGRPEWSWPDGVPKLKTIGQLFKEQGGFEVDGTIKGADMVGWKYRGPFDDLPAQQQPGGFPEDQSTESNSQSAVECHQVIDGGRDSRGKAHVVAGEGTGIVHIAPGCGDIDHKLGAQLGLVGIAPLEENGRFGEGFGEFTGREAIDPDTAQLVFENLRGKELLVATEVYPHVYPHCWRTGDELVFRLVDEWFINMDWRKEIQDVVKQIKWLPPEMQGQDREVEWLSNMGDWMISKKRFWGLALPIWVDEETGDFEVIGSLAELKERAVEGWDVLEGHTPHRPWIDAVKIENPKNGNRMTRVPDVGNPWLDAGIVPFSTMHYNTDPDEWQKWYPGDFVTECFPGQFRNWFYSLLSLSTMMRHDETDDPVEKRPFTTLLGHRLVTDEGGKPMHKTDGTAIWFEEAAEQIGVDTLRWLYLAQNPSHDLRFGTRHPDEPVTIETPEGPIDETKEGLPICKVTSQPSDEVRRQILIPLWNSYAFFVNYARLDEFDPTAEPLPVADRPEIDRWILSNLQALIATMNESFQEFDSPAACSAAAEFIDDLSNWYIRRNRRRFWRSRKETQADDSSSETSWDEDKLAAYQTLYEVLTTLTKLLAPCIPFLSERMYRNLSADAESPESVHLCEYPQADESLLDADLNERMALAQQIVKLGHKLREGSSQRVRQPLAELRYTISADCSLSLAQQGADPQGAVASLTEVIREELNVKQLTGCDNLDDLVSYSYKPNLKTLGPKYGKLLGIIRKQLPELPAETLAPLRAGESVTVDFDGNQVTLASDDVLISTEQSTDWFSGDDAGIQLALNTELSDELRHEGMRNDFIRLVQSDRKIQNLDIEERINITWLQYEGGTELQQMLTEWNEYICRETLADSIEQGDPDKTPDPEGIGTGTVGSIGVAIIVKSQTVK